MKPLFSSLFTKTRAQSLAALRSITPSFAQKSDQTPETEQALETEQIVERTSPAVVVVTALNGNGQPIGFGSGFFIANGKVIATNYHVIEKAATVRIETESKKKFQVEVVARNKANDIALLGHRGPEHKKPLELSTRDHKTGEYIVVIGNPKGLNHTMSDGRISRTPKYGRKKEYQISAPISPGSSGGPVMDKRGIVLGIATSSMREGQNLNFAIPSIYVQKLLDSSKGIDKVDTYDSKEKTTEYLDDNESDPAKQYRRGKAYYSGDGVPQDYQEAARWFRRAADQGNADAQFELGKMYYEGKGVPDNHEQAAEWFRRAGEKGNADAQFRLGEMYYEGEGVSKSYEQAEKWYLHAAVQGHTEAQIKLGYLYHDGEGVAKNDAEAAKWFRRAAERGDYEAQYRLGFMHWTGKGIEQNHAKAVGLYRHSAEQDDPDAQYMLGVAYRHGLGVKQDYTQAVKWYRLAVKQGHADAQNNLGVMYAKGWGVSQSYGEAVNLFRHAARGGSVKAYFNLGVSYFKGLGVPKNIYEAHSWFSRAAENGYKRAEKYRDITARVSSSIYRYFAKLKAKWWRK